MKITEEKISGMGIAFGYMGSLIGFGVASLLQEFGYSYVEFLDPWLFFLLFSIPAFLFIEEKKFNIISKCKI